MPRRRRTCPAGMTIHVIQRGNNRQICFTSDADMAAYASWLAEGACKYGVEIHGWVFMSNHVHLLVTPKIENAVSRLMQYLGRLYVRYFNYNYNRTGTLFEGRFKSCVVQDREYLLTCLRYIELNPVRAGLVSDPKNYKWSSFRIHSSGLKVGMWTPHNDYLSLGDGALSRQHAYRESISKVLDVDVIAQIRHCTNTGLVLGTDKYIKLVARLVDAP